MNALTPPLILDPQEGLSESFLPSLYLTPAQVDYPQDNPHKDKHLQKNEVVKWLDNNGGSRQASQLLLCGTRFVHLRDSNGHEKWAKMHCHLEFCPDCGTRGSRVHKTRTTRARDRLMWAPVLGYVVFTLPAEIAASRLPRETLQRLEKEASVIIENIFKSPGGMNRVHLAGDRLSTLRIHVNALFPVLGTNGIGKMDPLILENARKAWTLFVNTFFNLNIKTADIHYSFSTTRKQKAGKIKYVLRPIIDAFMFMTLSHEDKLYILSLCGWHNTRWFGKLSNALYKKYLIEKGIDPTKNVKADLHLSCACPVCGGRYRFIDIVSRSEIPKDGVRWIDADTAIDFATFAGLRDKEKGVISYNENEKKVPPNIKKVKAKAPIGPLFRFS